MSEADDACPVSDSILSELENAAEAAEKSERQDKHMGATFALFGRLTPEMILRLVGRLKFLESQSIQTSLYIEDLHARLMRKPKGV